MQRARRHHQRASSSRGPQKISWVLHSALAAAAARSLVMSQRLRRDSFGELHRLSIGTQLMPALVMLHLHTLTVHRHLVNVEFAKPSRHPTHPTRRRWCTRCFMRLETGLPMRCIPPLGRTALETETRWRGGEQSGAQIVAQQNSLLVKHRAYLR